MKSFSRKNKHSQSVLKTIEEDKIVQDKV